MNKCVVYIVDDNIYQNKLLKISLRTLNIYNKIDVFILTTKNNSFKYNNVIFIDDYFSYLNTNSTLIRSDLSHIIMLKLFIPLIKELFDYDRILFLDCDIEITRNFDSIFMSNFYDNDILGEKCYNNQPIDLDIKLKNNGYNLKDFKCHSKYINFGSLLYNMKSSSFLDKQKYFKKLLDLLEIIYKCQFICPEQDGCFIFDYIKCGIFEKKYFLELKPSKIKNLEEYRKMYNIHYILDTKKIMLEKYNDKFN